MLLDVFFFTQSPASPGPVSSRGLNLAVFHKKGIITKQAICGETTGAASKFVISELYLVNNI